MSVYECVGGCMLYDACVHVGVCLCVCVCPSVCICVYPFVCISSESRSSDTNWSKCPEQEDAYWSYRFIWLTHTVDST